MILLGINAGLGNADIGALPVSAIDIDGGILDFPRPKTGIARRVPLWPETVKALRKILRTRKPRVGAEHLVIVDSRGGALMDAKPNGHCVDQTVVPFHDLAVKAGVYRPRMGFYLLRGATRDFIAVASIMGYADSSIGEHYREEISDRRLRLVTRHLHDWLFGKAKN